MKRKIDDLARIVIPAEMRKELGIELNQELEIEKVENKIIISNPKGMKSKSEIEKMLHDVSKLEATEYNKGFIDALKMCLNKEGEKHDK